MPHTYGDERIVEWLQENEYHPRSPAHGSASCLFFLDDLLHESDVFREAARSGDIVYQEDYTVGEDASAWNTDLVVGPPVDDDVQTQLGNDRPIVEAEPAEIWLAIDAKSVMTEHQKARRNRQRDINSFADIMHRHHPGAVTGGLLLVNQSERFYSPLRDEGDITEHEDPEQLVEETVEMFRDIDRAEGEVSPNVDGVGCIVVDHTNMDDGNRTRLIEEPPAPQEGDIVEYHEFLEIIVETLEDRWLTGDPPKVSEIEDITDLRASLDRQVVEIATRVNSLGSSIAKGDFQAGDVDRVRDGLERLNAILDQVEREQK